MAAGKSPSAGRVPLGRPALVLALLAGAGRGASDNQALERGPEGVELVLARAGPWLAAFPEEELRFDAAVCLAAIRRHHGDPAFDVAWERARRVADADVDNPLRRLWDRSLRASAASTSAWGVPAAGEPRVNVNRVVSEALHCAGNGLRPATLAYLAGPMRDGGGYHTTHALWALVLARENGCLDGAAFEELAGPLREELALAQGSEAGPGTTQALDLFAERLLMLLLAGSREPRLDGWAERLLALQGPDGSFGCPDEGERSRLRHHATLLACWALLEWRASRAPPQPR